MSRTPPDPPTITVVPSPAKVLFELDISVATPMFGGSATPREVDLEHPVTAKSVRGHLRFWWRACQAPRFNTAKEMYEAESAIWGSAGSFDKTGNATGGPSGVDVVVETLSSGQPVRCADFREGKDGNYRSRPDFEKNYPAYALFPVQGKASRAKVEQQPAEAREGVKIRLRISLARPRRSDADLERNIEAALWAWILFGGAGARAGRGCGSLWTSNTQFQFRPESFESDAKRHLASGSCSYGVPVLCGAQLLYGTKDADPKLTWSIAVELYRDFRQKPGFARNQPGNGSKTPGRSRWPEADSLRDQTRMHHRNHAPSHPARPYYPRADLGLPIVFHFKDSGDPFSTRNDTGSLEAHGDSTARMASPVIVKPLSLTETKAVPIFLFLEAPHVWDAISGGVALKGKPQLGPSELRDAAKSRSVLPLKECGGAETARDALQNYVVNTGAYKKVTLP